MYRLQKEAKRIKADLAKTHIFAEEAGVKITINGAQELVSVEITDDSALEQKAKLEKTLKEVFERAMKKSQAVAAERMKEFMGQSGLGGGLGG